jgi:hypothetical protein
MLLCNRGFVMPDDSPSDQGSALWEYASLIFAQDTKGKALTVIGDTCPASIWLKIELPALRSNPDATSIIALDPETCKPACYQFCSKPSDCTVSLSLFTHHRFVPNLLFRVSRHVTLHNGQTLRQLKINCLGRLTSETHLINYRRSSWQLCT